MATPMSSRKLLSNMDGHVLVDLSKYRRLVGSLQYLTLTRPNIAFWVNKIYQFIALPTDLHMLAAKRLIRYISETL